MSEIFISYDHRNEDWCEKVLDFLKRKDIKIRADKSLIVGGDVYEFVNSAVSDCSGFIIIVSREYIENRRYAWREFKEIVTRSIYSEIRVMPLIVDNSISTTDLPFGLASIKCYNLNKNNWEKILDVIANELLDIKRAAQSVQESDLPGLFIPQERRIRIQASIDCTQFCEGCHWDEFPRDKYPQISGQVKTIMERLRDTEESSKIYPRPNIEFALTGGEPLRNDNDILSWEDLANVYPEKTWIITNGRLIEDQLIPFLEKYVSRGHVKNILKGVRIHYPYIGNDAQYVTAKGEDTVEYIVNVRKNVLKLIDFIIENKIHGLEIRFNRLFSQTSLDVLHNYINHIESVFYKGIKENIVKGVALIEPFPNKISEFDIFDVANEFMQSEAIQGYEIADSYRKKILFYNNLRVEFLKLNCAITDDFVGRCFNCIKDQDISICSDGRIKICGGYDESFKPQQFYTHFNPNQPLVGIAGAIKRKYGLIGFYNIFTKILTCLRKDKFEIYIPEEYLGVKNFPKSSIKFDEESNGLQELTKDMLNGEAHYCKLYEEGIHPEDVHYTSMRLCTFLAWIAFRLVKRIVESEDKTDEIKYCQKLNSSLLLLAYFTVDEDLFSTARTKIVQGMLPILLKNMSELDKGEISSHFIEYSTYYLGTLLFENSLHEDVKYYLDNDLINSVLNFEDSIGIPYLLGCISRQEIKKSEDDSYQNALKNFNLAFNNAFKRKEEKDQLTWFYREILVEALRSTAAIKKKSNNKVTINKSEEEFLQANYYANKYQTRLRYHSLFSDGYAALINYFKTEFGKNIPPIHGWDAHEKLMASVAINADFYASLIRLGLLNISLLNIKDAEKELKMSNEFFEKRGLLTDQEYLNSLLGELLLWAISPNFNKHPNIDQNQILASNKVGLRDIRCVIEDASYFLDVLDNAEFINSIYNNSKLHHTKIKDSVKKFKEFCTDLHKIKESSI